MPSSPNLKAVREDSWEVTMDDLVAEESICGRTLQTAHTGQWRQCARAARDTTKGSWRGVEGGVEPGAVSGWRQGHVSGRSAAAAAACGKGCRAASSEKGFRSVWRI
ncbi:hypothetical protein GGX14DRAFT_387386 [Mycena pura]|uniref:Uncharacterized protein n=1 Tax=Mycena pura TaxID=153505 RepID=A0AAD6YPE7_9AGAR|nr:hypothetical protein GGX14DRAFT_387386 [Mycena pura]